VVAEPPAATPTFTTMTLSAEQLMALDWDGTMAGRPTVENKRIIGAGVEFDIRFPSNKPWTNSMDYTSTSAAGQGTLAGLDVRQYEAFALKFTLVSVSGQADPNEPLQIAAGALIGPAGNGRMTACVPVTLAAVSQSFVATTPIHTQRIRVIGFHSHVLNPQVLGPEGGVVTLRVEPASEAEVLVVPAPSPEDKPRAEAARSPRPKSRAASVDAKNRRVEGSSAKAAPAQRKPRTKSTSTSGFGTKRIGAW